MWCQDKDLLSYKQMKKTTLVLTFYLVTFLYQTVKDARSVSFRSELFTSYILTIFKQRNLLPLIRETAKYSYSCM